MAKGLPKSIIKKYGISKKAWEVYRGSKKKRKVNKSRRTSKSRRKTLVRRRSYRRKPRRRRTQKRISLIGTAGAIGSVFVPQGRSGAWSMGRWLEKWAKSGKIPSQDVQPMLYDTMGQYIGYHPTQGWGIPWATVTIIGAGIASKIANKYGGQYLRNLPWIGKYIRF